MEHPASVESGNTAKRALCLKSTLLAGCIAKHMPQIQYQSSMGDVVHCKTMQLSQSGCSLAKLLFAGWSRRPGGGQSTAQWWFFILPGGGWVRALFRTQQQFGKLPPPG